MRISEMIAFLDSERARLGDVEVYEEKKDMGSTRYCPLKWSPMTRRKLWTTHPDPRWYLTSQGD